jgi:small-conductance mechanosensitive channel
MGGIFARFSLSSPEPRRFDDQFVAQHELRKRIFKRLREEGIEIPFPVRTVYLKDERYNSS